MSLDPASLVDGWFSDRNEGGSQTEIEFYPVDEELDIFSDEEYMAYDRNVSYYDPDTGATYSVEEKDLATQEEYVRFFYSYFQTVIWGDAVNYAEHFSLSYEGELPEDFTMQMVYDIQIQPHLSSGEGNTYIVDYKIRKNNGTFRRDIGSDEGREYLFTLIEEQGELVILEMGPYTSYR